MGFVVYDMGQDGTEGRTFFGLRSVGVLDDTKHLIHAAAHVGGGDGSGFGLGAGGRLLRAQILNAGGELCLFPGVFLQRVHARLVGVQNAAQLELLNRDQMVAVPPCSA